MKKLVFIAPSKLPVPAVKSGGIEQLMENLINTNETYHNFFITVISAYDPVAKRLEAKYKYTRFKNLSFSFLWRIFNYLNRKIFSVLFQYTYYPFYTIQIIRYIEQIEFDYVVIFGNDNFILPLSNHVRRESLIFWDASMLFKRIDEFLLVGKIFVGSNYVKTEMLNRNNALIADNIKLIQSGIDINYFCNVRKANSNRVIRKKFLIGSNVPVLCYVGRLAEDKGVVPFLKAVLLIKEKCDFKLFVIGSFGLNFGLKKGAKSVLSNYEKEVVSLMKEIGDKCIHLGFVPKESLIDYLNAVDIGVVPSLAEDPSPLAYFQFQAMGIPCVVSDSGGIPEFYSSKHSIIVKRGSLFISSLSMALYEIITNNKLRSNMALPTNFNRESIGEERFFQNFVKLFDIG